MVHSALYQSAYIYSGPFGVDMMICTKGEKDEFCEAVLNQEGEDVNRTGLGVVSINVWKYYI